jgi:hypothetical protein
MHLALGVAIGVYNAFLYHQLFFSPPLQLEINHGILLFKSLILFFKTIAVV